DGPPGQRGQKLGKFSLGFGALIFELVSHHAPARYPTRRAFRFYGHSVRPLHGAQGGTQGFGGRISLGTVVLHWYPFPAPSRASDFCLYVFLVHVVDPTRVAVDDGYEVVGN